MRRRTRATLTKQQKEGYALAMQRLRPQGVFVGGHGAYSTRKPRTRAPATASVRRQIKGSGNYKSTVGARIGSEIGAALGYGAQQLVKYITGFGDYKVTSNSLMGGLYDPPEIRNLRERGVCIRHREYLLDITAASSFTLQSFPINPGLVSTFPWLSQVAEAFEEYAITGMIFEFKTLSADYTTASSAALGSVVMATQYNVLSPPFPNKQTMENYEFSNSGKPSETFIHPIECKKAATPVSELFVRTGPVPAGADPRLYDLGNFQIATVGNTGSGVLGELWCTFEVCFFKPKLVASVGLELATDHWQLFGVTSALPLGTSSVLQPGSQIGTVITTTGALAGLNLTFPDTIIEGNYLVMWFVHGTSGTLVPPTLSITNGNQLEIWLEDSTNGVTAGGTGSNQFLALVAQVTAPGMIIQFGALGTLPTPFVSGDLWVMQVNGGIAT